MWTKFWDFLIPFSLSVPSLSTKAYLPHFKTLYSFFRLLCASSIQMGLVFTINPQKRPAGLILSLRVKMRLLIEFGYCCLLFFKFTAGLIRIWVLFEGRSLSSQFFSMGKNLLSLALSITILNTIISLATYNSTQPKKLCEYLTYIPAARDKKC